MGNGLRGEKKLDDGFENHVPMNLWVRIHKAGPFSRLESSTPSLLRAQCSGRHAKCPFLKNLPSSPTILGQEESSPSSSKFIMFSQRVQFHVLPIKKKKKKTFCHSPWKKNIQTPLSLLSYSSYSWIPRCPQRWAPARCTRRRIWGSAWPRKKMAIAMENDHRNSGFIMIYPLKMVMFHSYVTVYQRVNPIP